jgi:hypothetical protein
MRKIPEALRQDMQNDPFYKRCCITGTTAEKIDWHHAVIFASRQVNEKWAILPLARSVHEQVHREPYKSMCMWIALNRATVDELRPYCKAIDYIAQRRYYNERYGIPRGI